MPLVFFPLDSAVLGAFSHLLQGYAYQSERCAYLMHKIHEKAHFRLKSLMLFLNAERVHASLIVAMQTPRKQNYNAYRYQQQQNTNAAYKPCMIGKIHIILHVTASSVLLFVT